MNSLLEEITRIYTGLFRFGHSVMTELAQRVHMRSLAVCTRLNRSTQLKVRNHSFNSVVLRLLRRKRFPFRFQTDTRFDALSTCDLLFGMLRHSFSFFSVTTRRSYRNFLFTRSLRPPLSLGRPGSSLPPAAQLKDTADRGFLLQITLCIFLKAIHMRCCWTN